MSLLAQYLQLYTNKVVIAMIMIILGVAIILYIIKKINEVLEPSQEEQVAAANNDAGTAGADGGAEKVFEEVITVANWSEEDFKKFQRRDLIDHYAFYLKFMLYYPDGVLRYEDKMTINIRDERHIHQSLLDMFQRQADANPDRTVLFNISDKEKIFEAINEMAEKLRIEAEKRSKSGIYGYAPYAGMDIKETVTLGDLYGTRKPSAATGDDDKFKFKFSGSRKPSSSIAAENNKPLRTLVIDLLLLSTDFTEPFYLKYKFTQPRNEHETTILDIQEEEENPVL